MGNISNRAGNGGGSGNGSGGNNFNITASTPPTSGDIKLDFIIDTTRRTLTLSGGALIFALLTLLLGIAMFGYSVYKLNEISSELASAKTELNTVNKRHFMLAQDWCQRMITKK